MSDERIAVTIQVLYVGQQQGAIDGDPILEVDLVVVERGNPPRPLATSLRVPMAKLALLRAGTEFSAVISGERPSVLDIDWSGLT
jgi:hypothetical protein